MSMQATGPEESTQQAMRRIATLEGAGAWEQAIEAWNGLVATAPDFAPARLGRAQACLRAGRAADALADLELLSSSYPAAPAPWLAIAHAHSMLGHHDDAIAAAERAVAAAPDHALIHLGLGDVLRQARRGDDASAAYERAVALAPDNVEALVKFSTMRRALRDLPGAATLLQRALEIAPDHPYARVNAGTLALALGRTEDGCAILAGALADPHLPDDAHREATEALAMLEEGEALVPAIEAAVSTNDPSAIAVALSGRRRATTADQALIACFDRMVERLAGRSDIAERYVRGSPRASAWPAIEAHHHYRDTRTPEAIAESIDRVERGALTSTSQERDIANYARLVADCVTVIERAPCHPVDGGDPIAFEALLRWIHARLVAHRRDRRPGMFKLGTLPGSALRGLSTRQPEYTQATFDILLRDHVPRLPEGPARFAFVHVAIVALQPFGDCNTRVARFLQNRLLAQGGWFPSLRPARDDRAIQERVLATADLEPMIASLAAGSHEAALRDREWASHGRG